MRNSPTADQNTFYGIRYIHGQMSSPTSQIIVHHIMRANRVCRPPHPNGILSSTIQTGWALFSMNTTPPAIHTHLISRFACKQSTFHSVEVHNRTIKSRSGDGSRHLGMWWTIVLHISWSTVMLTASVILNVPPYTRLAWSRVFTKRRVENTSDFFLSNMEYIRNGWIYRLYKHLFKGFRWWTVSCGSVFDASSPVITLTNWTSWFAVSYSMLVAILPCYNQYQVP